MYNILINITDDSYAELACGKYHHMSFASIPGKAGEGFVRISYSYSLNHLMEATKRIEEFLPDLKNS